MTFIISEKKPNVINILEKAEEDTEKKHREKMEIMKGFLYIYRAKL